MTVIRSSGQQAPSQPRGISIVRVSERAGRSDEKFISPREQEQRIAAQAAHDGVAIAYRYEEIDVSGKLPLSKRPGMSRAVAHVEAGEAEVIYVAYFDRLARNNRVKGEIVDRVEAMGEHRSVYAVGFGQISHKTATQRVTSDLLSVMNEFFARHTGEKTAAAREDALDRGIVVFPYVPIGYRKDPETRRLVVHSDEARLVVECFKMRRDGATVASIRAHLREQSVELSYRQVQLMFESRLYLGEIHDGNLVNPSAHEAIVDRVLWKQANEVKVSRGRQSREPRLLSKLGVLRCGNCGMQLFAGFKVKNGRHYDLYRCPGGEGCSRAVAISAREVESYVVGRVREAMDGISQGADLGADVEAADAHYAACQQQLDAAIENLAGIKGARQKLLDLQEAVDAAATRAQQARNAAGPAHAISAGTNWSELSFDGQRALIRSIFKSITVSSTTPGRYGQTASRVSCKPRE